MLTGLQIRAARSALRWSANELADRTEIASKTIRRIEACDGLPDSKLSTIAKIKSTFEAFGIEFIGSPDDAPGIRIHPRDTQD